VRAWLAERHEEARGRPPFERQLDHLVIVFRQVFMTPEAQDGATSIRRSIPQLVEAMKLPVPPGPGKNVRKIQQRYRNQIYRTLRYLEEMGLVDGAHEAPRAADGRGTCIVIHIPAGVAQSVRAALRGVRRFVPPLRRPLSWAEVSAPLRANTNVGVKAGVCELRKGPARAREPLVDANGPPVRPPSRAASDLGTAPPAAAFTFEGGGPVGAAIAAWREWKPDEPWRLSKRGAMLIRRYCAQLDELVGRDGYGEQWLVNQIDFTFEPYVSSLPLGRLPWDRGAPPGGGTPRSLGYFVRLLRRHARLARRRAPRG
jgi:hypothetical protein